MPNHVRNVIKFKNLKPKDIKIILDMIAVPIPHKGIIDTKTEYAIDFDKIIPEPRRECDCPEDCKVNKDSHVMEDAERPWFDWYTWHNKYWGTKWNAYDCSSEIGKSYVILIFSTAWSPALPILDRLTLLGYDFEVKYADEDWGSNCGVMKYFAKSKEWDEYDEFSYKLKDPTKFARNLWDKY